VIPIYIKKKRAKTNNKQRCSFYQKLYMAPVSIKLRNVAAHQIHLKKKPNSGKQATATEYATGHAAAVGRWAARDRGRGWGAEETDLQRRSGARCARISVHISPAAARRGASTAAAVEDGDDSEGKGRRKRVWRSAATFAPAAFGAGGSGTAGVGWDGERRGARARGGTELSFVFSRYFSHLLPAVAPS
jgi:hypothetical protein